MCERFGRRREHYYYYYCNYYTERKNDRERPRYIIAKSNNPLNIFR